MIRQELMQEGCLFLKLICLPRKGHSTWLLQKGGRPSACIGADTISRHQVWCGRAPTRSRLKLIPRIANVEQWARDGPLSSAEHKLLANYNDKPVLTRPQHRHDPVA